mmetsp:Transcript_665/g.1705  ORF Transcript_665/g.1705 Transcript_665/m.1705 type:complete len:244 (-) Transcript_665:11-742(-)
MSQTSSVRLQAVGFIWAKAMPAAVGALTSSRTEMRASRTACTSAAHCCGPYCAGMVTTASATLAPRYLSAILRRCSTRSVTTSSGRTSRSLPRSWTRNRGRPSSPRTMSEGRVLVYHWTHGLSYLEPIRRVGAKMVFSRFLSACSSAASPTSTPPSVKATTAGVASLPRSLGITSTSPSCHVATRELRVPRSMPMETGGPDRSQRVRMAKPICRYDSTGHSRRGGVHGAVAAPGTPSAGEALV